MLNFVNNRAQLGLALLASIAVADPTALLDKRQTGTCSSLHLMVAGGCQPPCASNELGLLSTTIANITAAIPNSDVYMVPYDGSQFQAAVSTGLMSEAANQYTAACPNTPMVFVGYSLGGIIVSNTLCGGISSNPNVIAAITYGEETFVYPMPYDRGDCKASAPKFARANPDACSPFAPVIRSYCDWGDPQCCTGGFVPDQHYQYAGKYDLDALAFVVSQYNAYAPNHAVPLATSPAPGSSSAPYPIPTGTVQPGLPFFANTSAVAPVSPPNTKTQDVSVSMPVTPPNTKTQDVSVTQTVVRTVTTTIPLYSPSNIPTPSIPAGGFLQSSLIPLSAVVLPSKAPHNGPQYSAGKGGIVVTAAIPKPSRNATATLTPYNPNAASSSSAVVPGLLFAQAVFLAWGLLM